MSEIGAVSVGIIENKIGEILLAESPKWNGKWILPGGHIEVGETIAQAAVRECKEELDLDLDFKEIIDKNEYIELEDGGDYYRPCHIIYFVCLLTYSTGKIKLQRKELTDYVWLKPQAALELELATGFREVIERYIERCKIT